MVSPRRVWSMSEPSLRVGSRAARPHTPVDYLHLAVIYVLWGTVYLGMKLAFGGPDALTAFQLQAERLLIGGVLIAALVGRPRHLLRMTGRQWGVCALCALLFWTGGNGFAILATREFPSSFVAMAMGTIPVWSAILHALVSRRLPTSMGPLVLGFVGLALIQWPSLTAQGDFAGVSIWATLCLLLAPVTWVAATMLQRRLTDVDLPTVAAVQLILGGLYAAVLALFEGRPWPLLPGTQSLLAMLYLAVFGSAVSFLSYIKAASRFPVAVVALFAYVNPIVGVAVGWLVLDERPPAIALAGMAVVIASVGLTLAAGRRRAQTLAR